MSTYENLHVFKAQKFISYLDITEGFHHVPNTSSLDDIMEENQSNTEAKEDFNTDKKQNDPQSPCSINLKTELLDQIKTSLENIQNLDHED